MILFQSALERLGWPETEIQFPIDGEIAYAELSGLCVTRFANFVSTVLEKNLPESGHS